MSKKKKLIINIVLLALFLIAIVYVTIVYGPAITRLASDPESFRRLLLSYGSASILIFMLFQVLQVVIAAIPGEFVQIAGGYVFGTTLGTVYSLGGILIGALTAFFIARILGFSIIKAFVSEKKIESFNFLMNSPKSELAMFLLFLIPGIPKDILIYIAGLTPIKPTKFFPVYVIARFPSLLGSSFIGANLQEKNYVSVIVVSVLACVLFAAGLLLKDKIIDRIHCFLHRGKTTH